MTRIGLVGARGYVGEELIRLVDSHPAMALGFVSSRERAGTPLSAHIEGLRTERVYDNVPLDALGQQDVEVFVLALPNGKAAECVAAIERERPEAVVIDLSADYRFDPTWHYGMPELNRAQGHGARRISNPGCYATAMQLAIHPLRDVLAAPVQCFGVSGYSGAGTTPGDKNDPAKLAGNLMPYSLTGHVHEREVTRHCAPVEFMPHVAPHFRGITLTANVHLDRPMTREEVRARFAVAYDGEPLIALQDEAPWVSGIAGRHGVRIGGFAASDDGRRVVVVSVLDNLLKGAATQAMQNLNIALGLDEFAGINLEQAT